MTVDLESLSDEELACESQAGSLAAFEELVRRFENRVYAFLYQFCRNQTDARELTQDTFVRAYQALHQFDTRQAFAPWLFTVARRKCIDHFRARKPVSAESAPEEADLDDPAALLAQREEAQNIWSVARRSLPTPQYQALWLKYVEEMNIAEIASALGKTQTHIKVMLLRARIK
jgi:RNA polymerase sigma-70 factor (ECF subfamily)